jgi:hypothetical protein
MTKILAKLMYVTLIFAVLQFPIDKSLGICENTEIQPKSAANWVYDPSTNISQFIIETPTISEQFPRMIERDGFFYTATFVGVYSLTKMAPNGTVIWQRSLPNTLKGEVYDMCCDENAIYACGSLWKNWDDTDLILLKWDYNGNLLLNCTYDNKDFKNTRDSARYMVLDTDSIYCAGITTPFMSYSLVVKFSKTGELLWSHKVILGEGPTYSGGLLINNSKIYIPLGFSSMVNAPPQFILHERDLDGNLVSSKNLSQYGDGYDYHSKKAFLSSNKSEFIFINSNHISHYNSSGHLIWRKTIATDFPTYFSTYDIYLDQNNYYIGGLCSYNGVNYAAAAKFASSGEFNFYLVYGNYPRSAFSSIVSFDQQIYFAGFGNFFPESYDQILISFNESISEGFFNPFENPPPVIPPDVNTDNKEEQDQGDELIAPEINGYNSFMTIVTLGIICLLLPICAKKTRSIICPHQ